jgi:hypothetical protein
VIVWQWVPAYNLQVHANLMIQFLKDGVAFDVIKKDAESRGRDVSNWHWAVKVDHSCALTCMRNKIIEKALAEGVDYLMMQDSDVYCLETPFPKLLGALYAHDATAAYAAVLMRTRPIEVNVWPEPSAATGNVFEVEKAGTGCVLIDLNKIREWRDKWEGPLFDRIYHDVRRTKQRIGHDVFFAKLIRDPIVGGRLVCDCTIPTVHVDGTRLLSYDGGPIPDEYRHRDNNDSATPEDPHPGGIGGNGNGPIIPVGTA